MGVYNVCSGLSGQIHPVKYDQFQYNFAGVLLWWSSTKIVQAIWIRQKNMAARGRGLFSLYIYIENFKKSSCQKPLDRFQYNFAGMFVWWSCTKIVQAIWIRQKHGCQGAELIFPTCIYLYGKLLKASCQKHWADFNIILQKRSFSNPLPRLFKPFGFLKKHGHQRAGLIFPIYLYRKV